MRDGDGGDAKRSFGWGLVGSAVCPGLGQIAQGEYVKGAILVGVFVLGLLIMAHLPHEGHGRSYFGPAFWLVSALLTADWLYAVVDIARAPARTDSKPPEKDGWQV